MLKPNTPKKLLMLHFRVDAIERKEFVEAARLLGMDMSEWMRDACREKLRRNPSKLKRGTAP